jgi:hypothetical protein
MVFLSNFNGARPHLGSDQQITELMGVNSEEKG